MAVSQKGFYQYERDRRGYIEKKKARDAKRKRERLRERESEKERKREKGTKRENYRYRERGTLSGISQWQVF